MNTPTSKSPSARTTPSTPTTYHNSTKPNLRPPAYLKSALATPETRSKNIWPPLTPSANTCAHNHLQHFQNGHLSKPFGHLSNPAPHPPFTIPYSPSTTPLSNFYPQSATLPIILGRRAPPKTPIRRVLTLDFADDTLARFCPSTSPSRSGR